MEKYVIAFENQYNELQFARFVSDTEYHTTTHIEYATIFQNFADAVNYLDEYDMNCFERGFEVRKVRLIWSIMPKQGAKLDGDDRK